MNILTNFNANTEQEDRFYGVKNKRMLPTWKCTVCRCNRE